MTLSKWTIQVELGEWLTSEVAWVVVLAEVVCPGTNCTDVETEELLVGCRADGEGVELSRILGSTGYLHPLAGLVVECDGSLEVHTNNL